MSFFRILRFCSTFIASFFFPSFLLTSANMPQAMSLLSFSNFKASQRLALILDFCQNHAKRHRENSGYSLLLAISLLRFRQIPLLLEHYQVWLELLFAAINIINPKFFGGDSPNAFSNDADASSLFFSLFSVIAFSHQAQVFLSSNFKP